MTVLICSPSCKTIHKDEDRFLTKTKFKVISIKNDKSIFIIEAIRNDSIFKILSDKGLEKNKKCNYIKKNSYYNFHLKKLFPLENASGSLVSMVNKFRYKETLIKIERKYHSSLYLASNLEGLCIYNDSVHK